MDNITRRNFLNLLNKALAFTGLAAVFTPIIAYFYPSDLVETPSEPVLVCKEDELAVGQGKTVRFGRYPALVINTPEGIKAYSAVCTHFACIVKWDQEKKTIYCPCHDGYFDPGDGHVISGPPPTPLTPLSINIENGEIFVGVQA